MPFDGVLGPVSYWGGFAWVYGIKPDLWEAAKRSYTKNLAQIDKPNLVTLIDYRVPKKEKRMWILDFATEIPTLVASTWCAHGTGSGEGNTKSVGKHDRKSCVGGFVTGGTWMSALGQKDKSVKSKRAMALVGLDPTNSNAANRGIRWHGAHYVKPGNVGNSWGCICPPQDASDGHIARLSHGSFIFAYFGEDSLEV